MISSGEHCPPRDASMEAAYYKHCLRETSAADWMLRNFVLAGPQRQYLPLDIKQQSAVLRLTCRYNYR